jgi:RNA polymerase sigma-70 factor (ECF subfamily)
VIGQAFAAVLASAKAGDHSALEVVYRDLAPPVLGYLRAQGAREPEDVASEVFVALVRGLVRFKGDERDLRSWVFTIAHRRLVDERRRNSRRLETPADPETLRLLGPAGDVEGEAMALLNGRTFLDAVRRLTPDQRSVVLLRMVADLPVADVARVLGRSQGAVKTLQRRALARLAADLLGEAVS